MTSYLGTLNLADIEVTADKKILVHVDITPAATPGDTPEVVPVEVGEYSETHGMKRKKLSAEADLIRKTLESAGYTVEFDPETSTVPSTLSEEQAAVLTTPIILSKEN